jgi:hypothetical protein
MIGSSRVPDLRTSLAISIPRTDAAVIQARMPYGLIKPDVSDSVS